MDTKICPSCGKEIDALSTFCTYCGTAQAQSSRTEVYPPEATPQQWPRREEPVQPQTPPVRTPSEPTTFIPPVPPTRPAPPAPPIRTRVVGEEGSGMGWIVFLRVILWVIFATSILGCAIAGIAMMDYDVLGGIAIILAGILGGFIVIAGGMVALNNASNQRKIANNTAKILLLLQNRNEK